MTTVLVAAPTAQTGARWRALLGRRRAYRVVTATLGTPLAPQIRSLEPDVVLLDLGHERVDAAIAALAQSVRRPAVVLTEHGSRELSLDALRVGIHAVLSRDAPPGQVLAAVEAVAAGLAVQPAAAMLRPPPPPGLRPRAPVPSSPPLTAREIEVLRMMADGLANKAIAARLGVSDHTAKFHVASILFKLTARSRTEAVALGVRAGLISI